MGKWKKKRELFMISLVIVFLLLLGSLDMTSPQARLDIPGANLDISNAVSMTLIKKIALQKSKETWGPGALGNPIPLSNLDGDVVVYMFSYRIGKQQFPAYDEILQGIKEGRELRNLINNSEMEEAKTKYMRMDHGKAENPRTVIISNSQIPLRPPMNPVRPDGSPSRRNEVKEIRKFASEKAIGANEYGTILVSATYDLFPVLAYFHSLAPYYINFDLALERAKQAIGQGASLGSIYFLGLAGQYFEFVNNSSSIVFDSKTLGATTVEALKTRMSQGQPQMNSTLLQERKEKIRAEIAREWEKIKSEIGGQ